MTYLCYQMEEGESGTPHWQGYVHWINPTDAVTYARREWNTDVVHWATARGSASENRSYCSKTSCTVLVPFQEFGSLPRQGQRSDLQALLEAIQAGEDDLELYDRFGTTYLRHLPMVEAARAMEARKWMRLGGKKKVIWLHGDTGVGKSRVAFSLLELFASAWVSAEPQWFNGYHGQEAVLFEDFSPEDVDKLGVTLLLRLTDRYPLRVPVKLSSPVHWLPRIVIFTSNWSVSNMHPLGHRMDAFKRRVDLELKVDELTEELSFALQYILYCL